MRLSAPQLEHWDRCRRMATYLEEWQPNRITPLGAVYAALDRVLCAEPYPGPQSARDHVMDLAGERGVHTERPDPYPMMVHYAHLAEVLARTVRQPSAEALNHHPVVKVGAMGLEWQPTSYLVEGGTRLMRVVLVDHWDDDRQLAECHGWRTIGDVCVTGLPMTLRVLVIGHSSHGKRYSHWTRARQHPTNKRLRFQRKNSKDDGFSESWGTVWREDTQIGPDAWIGQMARDGVLRELAFDRKVIVPGEYARARVMSDIVSISIELGSAVRNQIQFPMTRSACDSPLYGPCRFQGCCLAPGPDPIDPEETGLFSRRPQPVAATSPDSPRAGCTR